jgi:hypothetical protein
MPRQDAQGRWISDDGLTFWDGTAWRPIGAASPPAMAPAYAAPAATGKSPWPAILIGCGIALLVVIVLGIVGLFAVISNPNFQRSFCNGWQSSDPNQTCPFSVNSQ